MIEARRQRAFYWLMGNKEAKKNAFRVTQKPRTHGLAASLEAPPPTATVARAEPPPPQAENLGALPRSYASDSIFLIARDPEMLFTYWDIAWIEHPPLEGRRPHLRLFHADGTEVYRTAICADNSHWYIPVGQGSCQFYAEIGFFDCQSNWEPIARSNIAHTPQCKIAAPCVDHFATLPYHLAFQRVVDLVAHARDSGEPLLETLARVQEESSLSCLLEEDHWEDRQRLLVAALLGYDDPTTLPTDPEALEHRLREGLQQRLSSHGKALAATTGATHTFGEQIALQTLADWTLHAGSDTLSSFSLSASGSEAFASWQASATASATGVTTSWSSHSNAASSWSSHAWAIAAGGSETLSSENLSSGAFSSGAFSSPGGISSSNALFHPRSSTSSSPNGGAATSPFFSRLHVESTFHGQTLPGSRVWIAGREIAVGADGAFHYQHPHHGEEVAIIVISPDGREHHLSHLRHTLG